MLIKPNWNLFKRGGLAMNTDLKNFSLQFASVVFAVLFAVMTFAFFSIPYSLQHTPSSQHSTGK